MGRLTVPALPPHWIAAKRKWHAAPLANHQISWRPSLMNREVFAAIRVRKSVVRENPADAGSGILIGPDHDYTMYTVIVQGGSDTKSGRDRLIFYGSPQISASCPSVADYPHTLTCAPPIVSTPIATPPTAK